ncbi:DUF648 domain-containing protein [Chlamydia ibidis]|nr:DUF648 domain-containing protein [Chlamydia ibidis]
MDRGLFLEKLCEICDRCLHFGGEVYEITSVNPRIGLTYVDSKKTYSAGEKCIKILSCLLIVPIVIAVVCKIILRYLLCRRYPEQQREVVLSDSEFHKLFICRDLSNDEQKLLKDSINLMFADNVSDTILQKNGIRLFNPISYLELGSKLTLAFELVAIPDARFYYLPTQYRSYENMYIAQKTSTSLAMEAVTESRFRLFLDKPRGKITSDIAKSYRNSIINWLANTMKTDFRAESAGVSRYIEIKSKRGLIGLVMKQKYQSNAT